MVGERKAYLSAVMLIIFILLIFPNSAFAEYVCQYAASASSTSYNSGSEPVYATGAPDANGNCAMWSGTEKSWNPAGWNIRTNLTLDYLIPLYVNNITIFGDYDICWNRMWLKNSETGEEKLFFTGYEKDCNSIKTLDESFMADAVILETCGWSWSSTDAVELCGNDFIDECTIDADCDDGDASTEDICTSEFICEHISANLCGNSIIEDEEECDDGNHVIGDGCSDCRLELTGICQFASSAYATDELPGYEAIYAIGMPDSDGDCNTPPLPSTSWQKTDWNSVENITLIFPSPIYANNLTIFGDYNLCMNRVWFWKDDVWSVVRSGGIDKTGSGDCKIDYDFSSDYLDYKTDKVLIETCGWTLSAVDSVEICGDTVSFPKISIINPTQDTIIDSSKNNIMIEIYTDIISECEFSYNKNFLFNEGIKLSTSDGLMHSYSLTKPISLDSIEIYYKCQNAYGKTNPYGMMHRFDFRDIEKPFIEICDWYGCKDGAVSISVDNDPHLSLSNSKATCRQELDDAGIKGTYLLTFTDKYSQSDWDVWKDVYDSGHEIGGHSTSHACSSTLDEQFFINDIELNREDITKNIGMPDSELTVFGWPCGIYTPSYEDWISDKYLFARGYHFNSPESADPENFMNLKSINTLGVGITPPNYFLMADVTENHQAWANYVYHYECNNPELFDYLLTRNLWIEPIGTVSKYLMRKNTVSMQNIRKTGNDVIFDLVDDDKAASFNNELTLKIYLGTEMIDYIKVNGENSEFELFMIGDQQYAKFNVPSQQINEIEISGLDLDIPHCGDEKINQPSEQCDDGNNIDDDACSNDCRLNSPEQIYIISYVANIDGSADPLWYPFFDKITKYYEDNKIPVAVSFFPASINNNPEFTDIFRRIYLADNMELMQKGYRMDDTEKNLDKLPLEEQKRIILDGRLFYVDRMKDILDTEDIDIPVTYVAPFGRLTETTRWALELLGFQTNFGLYYPDDLKPVEGTPTLDMIQYGVSFTVSGTAGRETVFKQPDQIIQEINDYYRTEVPILKLNGRIVIPLFIHQPDFEHATNNNEIDNVKWNIYDETITRLNNDPNIKFITPQQVWTERHPVCIPTSVSETYCNGIDNNCDGNIDEGFVSVPTTCGIGACRATGMLTCNGYEYDSCIPGTPAPLDLNCDGIDEDCDGLIDEDCSFSSMCQYATAATATSSNLGSEPVYATGAPDANGNCAMWSGTEKSWNPAGWNIKANITLDYEVPVYADNITIFGDYDMCWRRMWLKDSTTGEERLLFSGAERACKTTKISDGTFFADRVILETCGWSWSSTDSVMLCGTGS